MNNGSFVAEGTVAEIFSQPDLLSSVRLDLPILPKLISSLRSKGIAIDMGYTYQEAEIAFLKAFGKIA